MKALKSEKLLPQALKQCGYDTEMYGKWHVGMFHEDYQPHRRGFDHFLGFLTGGADFWTHRKCYDSVWIHNLFSLALVCFMVLSLFCNYHKLRGVIKHQRISLAI